MFSFPLRHKYQCQRDVVIGHKWSIGIKHFTNPWDTHLMAGENLDKHQCIYQSVKDHLPFIPRGQ